MRFSNYKFQMFFNYVCLNYNVAYKDNKHVVFSAFKQLINSVLTKKLKYVDKDVLLQINAKYAELQFKSDVEICADVFQKTSDIVTISNEIDYFKCVIILLFKEKEPQLKKHEEDLNKAVSGLITATVITVLIFTIVILTF